MSLISTGVLVLVAATALREALAEARCEVREATPEARRSLRSYRSGIRTF